MELLDKCGSQRLRCDNVAISKLLPKCSPLVTSQACFCEVYHGSHSDKGHGNKAAISEAEVCPPVRAKFAWLPYQSFNFPEQLWSFPSGALGSA
jgi:hypothetical protein